MYLLVKTIATLLPILFAAFYGLIVIAAKRKSLYMKLPILGICVVLIGDIMFLIQVFSGRLDTNVFNICTLSPVGASLFFLSANRGSVAKFVDDGSPQFRKYRIIALLSPLFSTLYFLYGVVITIDFISDTYPIKNAIVDLSTYFILCSLAGITSYFTLKCAIIPDEKNGFIDSMRPYNIVLTILLHVLTFENTTRYLVVDSTAMAVFLIIYYVVYAILVVSIFPLLERGRKKCLE